MQLSKIKISLSASNNLVTQGLRPYVLSRLGKGPWKQAGKGVQYQKQRLIYDFLYD